MTHRTRRSTTERGFEASCACGWRCCYPTRQLRDQAADAHELELHRSQVDHGGRADPPIDTYTSVVTTPRDGRRGR
jgi:hypothetical protein